MVIGENVPPRFLSLCFRSVSVFCSFMVKYFIIHHFIFLRKVFVTLLTVYNLCVFLWNQSVSWDSSLAL